MKNTLLVFGDQLSLENTALDAGDPGRDRVLLIEARDSGPAHKIKRVFHIAALRAFGEELAGHGWEVEHHRLGAAPSFREALLRHLQKNRPSALVAMEPNNWSQQKCLEEVAAESGIPLRLTPTCQFLTPRAEFLKFANGKKRLLMEAHYRRMRQNLGILMRSDGEPEGGAWNYDAENRLPPPKVHDWGKTLTFQFDEIDMQVKSELPDTAWGQIDKKIWGTTRAEALKQMKHFLYVVREH